MTICDLKNLKTYRSKIRSMQQRVDRLRCAMYSPASPVLSNTPHGGGIGDPTAKAAIAIAEMEHRLLELIIEMEGEIEKVEREICKMPEDDQNIIRERYINGLSWRQVARVCRITMDGCFKRHKKILDKLERTERVQ